MEFIASFFDSIHEWLSALGEWTDSVLVQLGAWYVIAITKAKIAFISYSWLVAQEVLNQLNISSTIQSYWGQIDSEVMGYISWFKIPEALNMLLNAGITRYVMDSIR